MVKALIWLIPINKAYECLSLSFMLRHYFFDKPSHRSGTIRKYRSIASMKRDLYIFGETTVGSFPWPPTVCFKRDSSFLSNV
jgi:hypothetical protein